MSKIWCEIIITSVQSFRAFFLLAWLLLETPWGIAPLAKAVTILDGQGRTLTSFQPDPPTAQLHLASIWPYKGLIFLLTLQNVVIYNSRKNDLLKMILSHKNDLIS